MKLLQRDPSKRPNATAILEDPWVQGKDPAAVAVSGMIMSSIPDPPPNRGRSANKSFKRSATSGPVVKNPQSPYAQGIGNNRLSSGSSVKRAKAAVATTT